MASPLDNNNLQSQDLIGAIKIKDGLFIGDQMAAQDLEFVWANKVTHIINCAGRQVANHWQPIGVFYQTYYWLDQDNQIILDSKDSVANQTFQFIQKALNKSESILVHSVKGQSRSSCIICAFLMRKYRWTLLKTLEFLNSRRPQLQMRASFIHQLSTYESRLVKSGMGPKTSKWTELAEHQYLENEELLLRNTFLNAQMGPLANYANIRFTCQDYDQKIRWIDLASGYAAGSAIGKKKLAVFNSQKDLINKKKVQPVNIHRKLTSESLRPAIKGSREKEIKRSITPPPKKTTIVSQHQAHQRIGSARASKNRATQQPQVFYNNFLNDQKPLNYPGSVSANNNPVSAAPASGSSLYANLPKSQASTQSIAKPGNAFQKYEPVLSRPQKGDYLNQEQFITSKSSVNYTPLQQHHQPQQANTQAQQYYRQNSARDKFQKNVNYDFNNKQITSSNTYISYNQSQSTTKHTTNSDSLSQIRKLQQSLSQVLKINPNQQQSSSIPSSTTAPSNVSSSGVTNIINNNNINNFYFPNNSKVAEISAYQATPTISAVTHQPRSVLSKPQSRDSMNSSSKQTHQNKENTISSTKTITKSAKPKRPSTAGPQPQDRVDLLNDDLVSGLKTNYGKKRGNDSDRNLISSSGNNNTGSNINTRSSYDRGKFSNNDQLRSSLKTLGNNNLITDANKKKRQNSLRKSADPSISQSNYPNRGGTAMQQKGGSYLGSASLTASSFTATNPIPSSTKQSVTRQNQGYLSDRSIGSSRGNNNGTSAAASSSQSSSSHQNQGSVALNIGSNTYRGGGGNSKESGYPAQTASSMIGYNSSISTNNISSSYRPSSHNYNPSSGSSQQQQYIQFGMNSFRSGPVKATTEVVDFSRPPPPSSSSSNQMRSMKPPTSSLSSTAQNNDLEKRQKTFAQNRPPSPGAKGTSDQPYNIYANPNKDKKIVQTAKNKYRMRSISPGQQNQPQNLSASATSNMYQMRGYSPSKPRWKF